MKIGFDAKRYYHNHTGLGNYSRTIVKGLQQYCPEISCELYDLKILPRTFRMGRIAASESCQLLHGLSNELPADAKKCGIPTVVTMHDVAWRTFPAMYHWIDRQLYDWKYGRSCQDATRVIAISESTKRDVMRFYQVPEERIEVIYQPVQQGYYQSQDRETVSSLVSNALPTLPQDFILYVGSINSRKNLLAAVEALALIPADQRPFLLAIGNGGEYRQRVENRIHELQLEPYVRIESEIHDSAVLQALYAKALAFVYPSFYEGFGLPVVEAALQHTPVITTTISSLPEAAGSDACLVDPHDKDAVATIAHYYERLTGDAVFRDAVATKMEAYARSMFSPEAATQKVVNLYKQLL